MRLVWRKRRKAAGLPPKARKKPANPLRSKAAKASYRRRWRDGTLVKAPKKRRLTDAERSVVALAAVETRRQRRLEKAAKLAKAARKRKRTLRRKREEEAQAPQKHAQRRKVSRAEDSPSAG